MCNVRVARGCLRWMAPLVADDRGVEAREDGHHGGLRGGGFPDETGRGGAAGRVHQSGGGLGGGARARASAAFARARSAAPTPRNASRGGFGSRG